MSLPFSLPKFTAIIVGSIFLPGLSHAAKIRVDLLQPSPVTALAKRGDFVCAGIGFGVIQVNARNGKFHSMAMPALVTDLFPIAGKTWGLLSENKFYKWVPSTGRRRVVYKSRQPLLHGLSDGDEFYLVREQDVLVLDDDAKVQRVLPIPGVQSLGVEGEDLVLFSTTSITTFSLIDYSSRTLPSNVPATSALVAKPKEFIAADGENAYIIPYPDVSTITVIHHKRHGTYESISGFDYEGQDYWMHLRLSGETAVWAGESLLYSFPTGDRITPPASDISRFVVAGQHLFTGTRHGLVEMDLTSGRCVLFGHGVPVHELDRRVRTDLNWDAHLTCQLSSSMRWLGGVLLAPEKNRSFLLDKKRNLIYVPLESLNAMKKIRRGILLSGYAEHWNEGGSLKYTGGLVLFNPKTRKSRVFSEMPVSHLSVDSHSVEAEGLFHIADRPECIRRTVVRWNRVTLKQLSEESSNVCKERQAAAHEPSHRVDAKLYAELQDRFPDSSTTLVIKPMEVPVKRAPLDVQTEIGSEPIEGVKIPLTQLAAPTTRTE